MIYLLSFILILACRASAFGSLCKYRDKYSTMSDILFGVSNLIISFFRDIPESSEHRM